jgi:hypothetical protein
MALAGGTAVNLTSGAGAQAFIAAGGSVYWVGFSGIYSCPGSGGCGASGNLYDADTAASGLATDGTSLYWDDFTGSPSVRKCALGATCATPTTVATLASTSSPGVIAVDATHVYWFDSSPTAGGVFEFGK